MALLLREGEAMLTKQCSRCHKIIPYGQTHCDKCLTHKNENKKLRTKHYDRKRDKQVKSFYNSADWITLSRVKIQQAQYKCEVCGEIATEVHHVVPVKADWGRRYDIDNLLALCVKCHNEKHDRF
jgi:5-methylcytosine-specific restriction protein A